MALKNRLRKTFYLPLPQQFSHPFLFKKILGRFN